MVDIITMLFTLVRNYFPAEIRWSPLQDVFDIFTFSMIMFTILYCMFFALRWGSPGRAGLPVTHATAA